ncbi:MAG: carbonic anhydrase [Anaerolineae bacterium]|nr:carbonic anhydrase [Anaerolineae bacterium]
MPSHNLERLIEGNRRFSLGQALRSDISVARRHETRQSQQPFAMILGCSDSRVPPEIIFDCGLGDLFVIRTGGHTIDKAVAESILFGIKSFAIPLVLVLGHKRCGAVSAALQNWQAKCGDYDTFRTIIEQITPAMEQGKIENCKDEDELLDSVILAHVNQTVIRLRNLITPISNSTEVLGAYYDLDTGIVNIVSG